AGKAEAAGRATGGAAKTGGDVAGESAKAAGSGVTGALKGVEAGRRTVSAATDQVTHAALTTWSVLKHRKLIVAGTAAGVTALSLTSFAAGRRTERNHRGPVARWTDGRL
ncbi:hypothetical protein P8605_42710, partial [Streptomyces sp. T-3]|nr:hypothetical protein [Streptomyces sp. T-3]